MIQMLSHACAAFLSFFFPVEMSVVREIVLRTEVDTELCTWLVGDELHATTTQLAAPQQAGAGAELQEI